MKGNRAVLFLLIAIVLVERGQAQKSAQATQKSTPIRVLLIVAHPDDESEMAATVYRITRELSGVVDQVIISNGEGGFRYSILAGSYYGADLTNEPIGRARLPSIRKQEARHAARVLGIRSQWFMNERDDHFTLDVEEVLHGMWRANSVENWLVRRLRENSYDLVFTLLPTEDTHGQHKAATILALRALTQLPEAVRPAIVAVQASPRETGMYATLAGYPITATNSSEPQFHVDRDVHFGFRDELSYQIVVNWVVAEHKSQGLFQTTMGQNRFENFWVFADNDSSATRKIGAFFEKLSQKSHADEPAGAPATPK